MPPTASQTGWRFLPVDDERDWRVLPIEYDEPEPLLDRSDALLDALAADPVPTLRWYTTRSTAIVLGRGQRRLSVRPSERVSVVIRPSGGGAVLLDRAMLCLDVLLPAGDPWVSDDLGEVFVHVGNAWVKALAALGIAGCRTFEGPPRLPSADAGVDPLIAAVCFASLGRGEVEVAGRKLVGLAQRRRRHGVLVQCGLLRSWNPAPLIDALAAHDAWPTIQRAAVGLDELVIPPPRLGLLLTSVHEAFVESRRPVVGSSASGAGD